MSDGLTNEEIISIVNEIRKNINDGVEIDESKYIIFIERYKSLYTMLKSSDYFDEVSFLKMLEMRNEVLSGKKSLKDNSEIISMEYFKKYHPDIKGI